MWLDVYIKFYLHKSIVADVPNSTNHFVLVCKMLVHKLQISESQNIKDIISIFST